MAEELASLIRDNLPSKHLVLSVEEAMMTLLQDETSSNGMLELEPMNPYNRLLIHRLADIFGFSHQSVGEGEERHIILQRCPDTSMPSVLVSDLLWEYDDLQYERFSDVPEKPIEEFRGVNSERCTVSLEDRQAAYLVARERIFAVDEYESSQTIKQRPPKNPVVARRMIAHALGQQAKPSSEKDILRDRELEDSDSHGKIRAEKERASSLSTENHLSSHLKQRAIIGNEPSQSDMRLPVQKVVKPGTKLDPPHTERSDKSIQKEKNEQVGAARRIFANALGLQPRNGNALKSGLKKETVE